MMRLRLGFALWFCVSSAGCGGEVQAEAGEAGIDAPEEDTGQLDAAVAPDTREEDAAPDTQLETEAPDTAIDASPPDSAIVPGDATTAICIADEPLTLPSTACTLDAVSLKDASLACGARGVAAVTLDDGCVKTVDGVGQFEFECCPSAGDCITKTYGGEVGACWDVAGANAIAKAVCHDYKRLTVLAPCLLPAHARVRVGCCDPDPAPKMREVTSCDACAPDEVCRRAALAVVSEIFDAGACPKDDIAQFCPGPYTRCLSNKAHCIKRPSYCATTTLECANWLCGPIGITHAPVGDVVDCGYLGCPG